MKNPLVSILIANYNNAKYIADCINSLKKQKYKNIEIIFFDDNSKDESINEIKRLLILSYYKNIYYNIYLNKLSRLFNFWRCFICWCFHLILIVLFHRLIIIYSFRLHWLWTSFSLCRFFKHCVNHRSIYWLICINLWHINTLRCYIFLRIRI